MNLYLNCSTDFRIVDDAGTEYTPEQARQLFEQGKVKDWNLGIATLAQHNWNLNDTIRYYIAEND